MEYNSDDDPEMRRYEHEEREKKRQAYGLLILLGCGLYIFGSLIAGEQVSVVGAIIGAVLSIYALHLLKIF